jgi:hypothetical protein
MLCTYGFPTAAFGALVVRVFPDGRWIAASANTGLPSARSVVPGVSG